MNPIRVALALGTVLVTGLSSFGYYGARANLGLLLMDAGESWSSTSGAMSAGSLGGIVLGGALAALLGGGVVVPLGLVLCASGSAAMAYGAHGPGVLLAAAGRSMAMAGAAALALRLVPGRREGVTAALLAAAYGALNVGAVLAPMLSGYAAELWGPAAACTGMAVVLGGVAILSIPLGVGEWMLPAPTAEEASAGLDSGVLGVVAAGAVVGAFVWGCAMASSDFGFRVADPEVYSVPLALSVNPAAVVLTCMVLVLGVGVAASVGVQVPSLALASAGLALAAVGAAASAVGGLPWFYLAQATGGAAEPLLWAGLVARVGSGVNWRVAAGAAAVIVLGGRVVSLVTPFVPDPLVPWVVALLAGVEIVFAVGIVAAILPVRALLDAAWATAESSAADDPADTTAIPPG